MSGALVDERCGTYAGVMHHARSGIPKCDLCKRAAADYMREYRRQRQLSTSVLVPLALLRQIEAEVPPALAAQVQSLTAGVS